jgi:hypothetical protein
VVGMASAFGKRAGAEHSVVGGPHLLWSRTAITYAIQANPGISAVDLAFKCEVDVRTIYRDLQTLLRSI